MSCVRPVLGNVRIGECVQSRMSVCPRNGRKIKDGLMKSEEAKRIITDIATQSSRPFIALVPK
jgi:hypothetical protein